MMKFVICSSFQMHSRKLWKLIRAAAPKLCHSKNKIEKNMLPSTYLIFVIFFTLAKFLENKMYTENANFSR